MEQLVILIIIGLISLVNWILQKAAEKRERARTKREAGREGARAPQTAGPPPLPRRPQAPSANDPMRDLMEALGLPADAAPPPTVRPLPPPVVVEEEFASVEDAPPPSPKAVPVARKSNPAWAASVPSKPDETLARLASSFNAYGQTANPPSRANGGIRRLLAGRESQRHAVMLAEILGPPRALRSSDEWLPATIR